MSLTAIKDFIVRRIAKSFLLKFIDGYKTPIMRVVQGISMVITGLILAATGVDEGTGSAIVPFLDGLNEKWVLVLNFLASLGLEFALSDRDAKARGK